MKKIKIILAAFFSVFAFSFIFASCSPKISLAAKDLDSVEIKFSTAFPEATAKALRQMTGAGDEIPIFAEADIQNLLSQAETQNAKVSIPAANELFSSGTTANSLSFSLGAEQFQAFYSLLSEEFKSYFDLMMIPSLIGEKMTAAEYEQLLSSMYGPTFAKDVVSGTLEISLSSPDGKKTLKDTISLGDILTLSETKTWKISW